MNLRVKLPENIVRTSRAYDESARYLASREYAKAKQFARLASDSREPMTRDFWRTASCDQLHMARRWMEAAAVGRLVRR